MSGREVLNRATRSGAGANTARPTSFLQITKKALFEADFRVGYDLNGLDGLAGYLTWVALNYQPAVAAGLRAYYRSKKLRFLHPRNPAGPWRNLTSPFDSSDRPDESRQSSDCGRSVQRDDHQTHLARGCKGSPTAAAECSTQMAGTQVSYELIAAIHRSRQGDRLRLCLVSIPKNCPLGDDRGKVYRATNLRMEKAGRRQTLQHSCGGA